MQREFQNIIIRMPNWLGDAVMATPILADLRARWPQANLTAMCQDSIGALLHGNPYLDEIFHFKRPNGWLHREYHRDVLMRLRQGKYDLGILLPNSFSSAWWFWRGSVEYRIGFASDLRKVLLTKALSLPQNTEKQHLVTTYKQILTILDIQPTQSEPQLFVSSEERKRAKALRAAHLIPEDATLIGINPGAAYGSAKCWLPERFRALIEKLIKRPKHYVLCFGDQANASLVHRICTHLPSSVINLAGLTSLRELIALIEQCHVLLTNDSGPMHIAAALKTPLVALFGSTNDSITGPYEHGHVIHKHVECSPCYLRTCPKDFRCMKRIETDEVFNALIQQLDARV